jgi:hypothetical protein
MSQPPSEIQTWTDFVQHYGIVQAVMWQAEEDDSLPNVPSIHLVEISGSFAF